MPRKGSFGEISAIQAELDRGRTGGDRPGYIIVKTFRQIRAELDAQGKTTAAFSQNGVLQIFEVGNQSPVNVDLEPNSPGTANRAARIDHHHHLDEDIAPTWTSPHRWTIPTAEISDSVGALNLTTTLPLATLSGTGVSGFRFDVTTTTGGNPSNQSWSTTGIAVNLLPGYTGTGGTYAMSFANTVAGTGTSIWEQFTATPGNSANRGIYGRSSATTSGHNVGVRADAFGGNVNAAGAFASYQPKASATNVGFAALARNHANTTDAIAGFFGIYGPTAVGGDFTPPDFSAFASSALVADSGSAPGTSTIAAFCNAGSVAWQWGGTGACVASGSVIGSGEIVLRLIGNSSPSVDIFRVERGAGTVTGVNKSDGSWEFNGNNTSGGYIVVANNITQAFGINFVPTNTGSGTSINGVSTVSAGGYFVAARSNASTVRARAAGIFETTLNTPGAVTETDSWGAWFRAFGTVTSSNSSFVCTAAGGWKVWGVPDLKNFGTITNWYGGYVANANFDGNGFAPGQAITNCYGLFLEEQTVGATINNEIFIGGAGEVFFRDQALHIGSLTDGHIDLTADVSIDSNADLEMGALKYLRMKSDGASYGGAAVPSTFGHLFVMDTGSGFTGLAFVNDNAEETLITTSGGVINIDTSQDFDGSGTYGAWTGDHEFQGALNVSGNFFSNDLNPFSGTSITVTGHFQMNGFDIKTGSSVGTGTRLGSVTTERIAFWGSTPIQQPPCSTGVGGHTTGGGTAVDDQSTFTGGGGHTTPVTIGGIVLALKNAGLLQS